VNQKYIIHPADVRPWPEWPDKISAGKTIRVRCVLLDDGSYLLEFEEWALEGKP
jgi:hypothetical protein